MNLDGVVLYTLVLRASIPSSDLHVSLEILMILLWTVCVEYILSSLLWKTCYLDIAFYLDGKMVSILVRKAGDPMFSPSPGNNFSLLLFIILNLQVNFTTHPQKF